MELIGKDAVVAEIERIEYETNYEPFTEEVLGKRKVCKDIKDLLDTLEVIEVKEVDLDYIKDELDRVVKIYKPDGDFGWGTLYNIAVHFYELRLKTQKGE